MLDVDIRRLEKNFSDIRLEFVVNTSRLERPVVLDKFVES
jgi:hypothetical protein